MATEQELRQKEELMRKQQYNDVASAPAYKPNQQVQNAQQQMQNLQGKKPAYIQSQRVTDAETQLQNLQSQKPQGYTSKYGPQLDAIMAEITNPKEFKWSFNGDELFREAADRFTQDAKMASMNAMGNAAALTGGYGNSYATQVGQQAYDDKMRGLYDMGMDLRDRAYQMYMDDLDNKRNAYGVMAEADEREYGRHRDEVGDWEKDRDYLTDRYDTESERDYGRNRDAVGDWKDDLDYYTGLYQDESDRDYGRYGDQRDYERGVLESDRKYNRDVLESDRDYDRDVLESDRRYNRDVLESDRNYNRGVLESDRNYNRGVLESDRNFNRDVLESDRNFEESRRQFNESLDWDKMSSVQKYAAEYAMMILQNGQMPSAEMLMAAGLSEEDAMKLMAQIQSGGGYTPKPKNNGDSEDKEPMSFYDYNVEVLKNTPMDVPLNQYGLSDTRTLGEIKAETDKKEEEKKKKAEANKTGGNWYLPESTKNKVSNLLKKK